MKQEMSSQESDHFSRYMPKQSYDKAVRVLVLHLFCYTHDSNLSSNIGIEIRKGADGRTTKE